MDLKLTGHTVTEEELESLGVELAFSNGYAVTIGESFVLSTTTHTHDLLLGDLPTTKDKKLLHQLLNQTVTYSAADNNGTLTLKFSNGSTIVVTPKNGIEPWSIAGSEGAWIVCHHDGKLTTFDTTN